MSSRAETQISNTEGQKSNIKVIYSVNNKTPPLFF